MFQFDQLPAAAANHKTELNCHQVFVKKYAKGLIYEEQSRPNTGPPLS